MPQAAMDISALTGKLDREREIYVALRDLSLRQMEVIDRDSSVEDLLEVLGRKQLLINEIEAIDRELGPFKKEWPLRRDSLDGAARSAVELRIRALQALLEELLGLEEKGRAKLQERQQDLAVEIKKISRSRQAHQAYGGAQPKPPAQSLIDNRG